VTRDKALLAAVLVTAATTAATPAPTVATPTPTQQATPQPTKQPTPQTTKQPSTVTLITGDRVTVTGQRYRVQPGPGREVSFTRQVREGHLYVIPSDALPLLAQDVLDRRLFDVTQLLQWRYGDADTPDIPVISQGFTSSQGQVRRLSALGMSASRLPKANAARTWHDLTQARTLAAGRTKLWLDGRMEPTLDESVKQIGAPQAWAQGFTGKGVTVAVLDSGYDPDHPDLKGAVTQERNFTTDPDIRDEDGHGTHVASIVASRDGKYRGVAPEANLAIGKVGGRAGITDSAVLAGVEWAATEAKAKIVNISLGAPDGPDLDPVEQAVNTLSERTGTLFVVAAGNEPTMVSTPGSADAALTVGAVDKQGRLADFSGSGPRAGDHAIKPDITAPGVGIVAAVPGGGHESKEGTSMAAPHVAGAAAILAQRHPDWTGARLKAALIGSAAPVQGATLYRQGAGLIDLVRVLRQDVVAQQANVWAAFPYNGSEERTATRTITYANSSDTPVTLGLEADGEVLKLPTGQITVPAKGEASLTLTIDTTGKAPGDYPGTVTARSGETVIRTLAGAYVEPESYDVTVTVVGRQALRREDRDRSRPVLPGRRRQGPGDQGRLERLRHGQRESRRKEIPDPGRHSGDGQRRSGGHGGHAPGQAGQDHHRRSERAAPGGVRPRAGQRRLEHRGLHGPGGRQQRALRRPEFPGRADILADDHLAQQGPEAQPVRLPSRGPAHRWPSRGSFARLQAAGPGQGDRDLSGFGGAGHA
jgi:subtilisin family serine protease